MFPMTTKYPIKAEKVEITDSTWIKFIAHGDTDVAYDIAEGWLYDRRDLAEAERDLAD